jgi:hypothetical protein
MAERGEEAQVQLATRIPKTLHRQLKLHCVLSDTSVMEFVVAALRERLTRVAGRGARRSPGVRRSRDRLTDFPYVGLFLV